MYIILPIAFAIFLATWFTLRKFSRIWINRPISTFESVIAGISAWFFISSILLWLVGIVLTLIDFIQTQDIIDIWAIILAILFSGYVIDFVTRSKSELNIDETQEFIKEALQFRRSTQRRIDIISTIQERRLKRDLHKASKSPEELRRMILQLKLSKEKEIETHIMFLQKGTVIDISDSWRARGQEIPANYLFNQVQEARIDPKRKRLNLIINLTDYNKESLKDEMNIIKLNRQIYDFLQYIKSDIVLKPYTKFIESFYLVLRTLSINLQKEEIYYPFMKLGITVSTLNKLEGSYFNPRKLSEVATVMFNNGEPV